MDIYASDEEKAEAIKQWWRENGRSVFVGVVLGIASIFGVRYWINYQQVQDQQAALTYQQAIVSVSNQDSEAAEISTEKLMQDNKKSAYSVFAALQMAEKASEAGEVDKAKDYLSWVIANAELSGHRALAKLRLAKVEFDNGQLDEALKQVTSNDATAFDSLFAELEGDIKTAQGQAEEAHAAYQKALVGLNSGEPRQTLIEMKLDDVAAAHES
ncbi:MULTISPECIES: YfgM family protein [Methylophaga]|jgi:predicted negative regulator of RcsB-dependent stress response|uniref:YfgM family protein n=1 Tax=Methylophaga TaxID=40222 RepID=UPI0024E2365A|nr:MULTISPECIES: tetratricopeptide repeat protein [Methylophaga]WVI86136.1 tetratricopeptide repeat protein [Methylophaga thalassica]